MSARRFFAALIFAALPLAAQTPPTFNPVTVPIAGAAAGGPDTTCNDAGVVCLFAASVSEGGPATTASALAANPANCSAGSFPLGVSASGTAEGCTVASLGDVVGPASATDNAAARFDSTTGKLVQDSALIIGDVSGTSLPLSGGTGNAVAWSATAPTAAAGASQAGKTFSIAASAAVASTDTAGAAAGGSVTITAGAAARLTSGNANGGDITLTPGAGIGTGVAGRVIVPGGSTGGIFLNAAGTASIKDSNNDGRLDFFAGGATRFDVVDIGGAYRVRFLTPSISFGEGILTRLNFNNDSYVSRAATGVVSLDTAGSSNALGAVRLSREIEANTAGSGAPNILLASESNKVLTNEGATAENYHTLPSAAAGGVFTFIVQDTDGLRIVAAAGDTIRPGAGAASGAAGFIRCATAGASITLVAINATEWMSIGAPSGVWTIDI